MKRIFLSPPDMGAEEREMLLQAFDSNWIAPIGPHVDAFEREVAGLVGVEAAAALSSGTAGLHLALHVVGVQPGDEVLTSTLTFAATANAITYVGARPVFLDVSPDTWTLDPDLLEEELARRARTGTRPGAVMTVDLYGQCADYDRICCACERFGVPLIEDAAEALGSTYGNRPAGAFGRCAVVSFNGNKIITTSGGGMLLSSDRTLVERARHLASQARDAAPHYEHSEIGFNYRMSNLLAALGLGQLRKLDYYIGKRRATNAFYRRALCGAPGIQFMPEARYGRTNGWLTCITVDTEAFGASREQIRQHFDAADIETRPVWKPMHLQPVFAGAPTRRGCVSEDLFARGLCLPSGSNLTEEDRHRIVDTLLSVPREARVSIC